MCQCLRRNTVTAHKPRNNKLSLHRIFYVHYSYSRANNPRICFKKTHRFRRPDFRMTSNLPHRVASILLHHEQSRKGTKDSFSMSRLPSKKEIACRWVQVRSNLMSTSIERQSMPTFSLCCFHRTRQQDGACRRQERVEALITA